ncbi:MAG: hypothetical protein K8R76_13410 [Candidatus Aegiribacteria sp.]|nr:hypothetical protein [Candidatus Aegiribacteria sp.]
MSDCRARFMNHEIGGRGPAKVFKVAGLVLLGIIGITLLAIVFGVFVKWLWNALMPEIFGLPEISYWQAVGLAVLAHIFFGAHGGPHHYERSGKWKKKKDVPTGDTEMSPFHREMEQDYAEFWREEGRETFKSWMRRENGIEPEES